MSKRRNYEKNMKNPKSNFMCGNSCGTMTLSERERGKNMWTVFNKNTGEIVKSGLDCEIDCEMWIAAQTNAEELAYSPF